MSRKNDLGKLIVGHTRRLHKLYEQKAAYGLATEPHVLVEIEDIETEIGKLQEELAALGELSHLNPYRGLSAFRETDRSLFFGREDVTAQLLESVQQKPLVTVLGPSGSGKSSVVFAGLIPCLRDQGRWLIASLRPGDDPCGALAAALLPLLEPTRNEIDLLMLRPKLTHVLSQGNLTLSAIARRILEKTPQANQMLLVVDQFEELYTLCTKPKYRQDFINIILQPVPCRPTGADMPIALHLVLTLRADFMGQALTCRPLADAMRDADVKLGPMMQAELRRAIETPAEMRQVSFEAGLVDRILADVSDEPGNLPLLEFALTNLWEQQARGELTHAAYDTIGRVKGALSRYADEVFGELSEDEQERARRVFVQMVRPGEGTENTRRLAHRDELSEADWRLVQQLASRRLLVTDLDPDRKETAEVIHEALIQDWAKLQQWMQKDRVFRAWQERLRAAVQQWQASQQDEGALLRGVPLAEAEEWLRKRETDLSPDELTFIRTSIELREKQLAEEKARHRREVKRERDLAQEQKARAEEQTRSARRLRLAVGVLAFVSVLVVILAGLAVYQLQEAKSAKEKAETAQATLVHDISIGLAYAAEEALARDPDLSVLLAIEAIRSHDENKNNVVDNGEEVGKDAKESLIQAVQQSPRHYMLAGHDGQVSHIAFSPDGKLAYDSQPAMDGQDSTVKIWDDALEKELFSLPGPKTGVADFAFDSDSRLVIAATDGSVSIWDLLSKEKLSDLPGKEMDETGIASVVLSPDGKRLATANWDGTVKIWNVTSGQELPSLPGLEGETTPLTFSPDGKRLAIADLYGMVKIWNVTSGKQLNTLRDPEGAATSLTFSPDGKRLAIANLYGTVKIWNVTSEQESDTLPGLEGEVTSLTFSPDGQWLVTLNSWDRTVKIWDVSSEKARGLTTLRGFEVGTTHPVFSPDSTRLVTAGMDGTITVWDMTRDEAEYQILDRLKRDENSTSSTNDLTTVWKSACQHTSRNLTYDEWAANLGEIRNIAPKTCSDKPIDLSFIVKYVRGEMDEAMKKLIGDAEPAEISAAYIESARQYSEQGKYQEAADALDQATKQDLKPKNTELAEAYYNICVSSSYSDARPCRSACEQAATLAPQTSDLAMNLEFCQNAVSYDLDDKTVIQAVCHKAIELATQSEDPFELSIVCSSGRDAELPDDIVGPICRRAIELATQSEDLHSLSDLCTYGPDRGLAEVDIQAVCQKAIELAAQSEDLDSLSNLCFSGRGIGLAEEDIRAVCQRAVELATQSEDLDSLSSLCAKGRDAELPDDIVGPICRRAVEVATQSEDPFELSIVCTYGRDAELPDDIVGPICQQAIEVVEQLEDSAFLNDLCDIFHEMELAEDIVQTACQQAGEIDSSSSSDAP